MLMTVVSLFDVRPGGLRIERGMMSGGEVRVAVRDRVTEPFI